MFSQGELEQVVAQEQEEKARKNKHGMGPKEEARMDPRDAFRALRYEALTAVREKFHSLLDSMYSNNKQGMFVALPKFLSENSFTGSPTVMTELVNNYVDQGGEKAYLLLELAKSNYHFSHVPSFRYMIDFIHNCEKVTSGELFWLFVLADELKVLTPEYEKMMAERFFKNRELFRTNWVKPYTKPSDEDQARGAQRSAEESIPDEALIKCVIAQRELIEFFVKKLG